MSGLPFGPCLPPSGHQDINTIERGPTNDTCAGDHRKWRAVPACDSVMLTGIQDTSGFRDMSPESKMAVKALLKCRQ